MGTVAYKRTGFSLLLFAALSGISVPAVATSDKQLSMEIATLFRSARAVISKNQSLINDASKGDKGLSPEKVVGMAKENYQKATSQALAVSDDGTLASQARKAMLDAVSAVMDQAQPLINEQGKGLKGFLPAVFAKLVADEFSKLMQGKMYIKLTAPKAYVRNRANRPDEWESNTIETHFKSAGWAKGKIFSELSSHNGKSGFRLLLPEYYGESCLSCHGEPKGSRDITGGKKEGGKLGELGGAISVVIYK